MFRAISARALPKLTPTRGARVGQCVGAISSRPLLLMRSFYEGKARLITQQLLDTSKEVSEVSVDIIYGDPDEAYIYIRPEVGRAFRDAVNTGLEKAGKPGPAEEGDPPTLSLVFDHASRRFTHGKFRCNCLGSRVRQLC